MSELTNTDYKDDICFFCYDKFTRRNLRAIENHIGCICRFPIHISCWERWDIFQCPICHSQIEEDNQQDNEQDNEQEDNEQEDNEQEDNEQNEQNIYNNVRENQLVIYVPGINQRWIVLNNVLPNINTILLVCVFITFFFNYVIGS